MRTPSPRESAFPPPGVPVVLVVEDEPVLRSSMVRGLAKLPGIEVMDAGTLADARALIAACPPALLVSDLDLPDGSGVELAAIVDRLDRRVPIVFVTAYLAQFGARLPERRGIEVYEKPLGLSRLREIVLAKLGDAQVAMPPFGVLDYVQLAGMGRRSVVLDVLTSGARAGRIVVRQGEVWCADDERGSGLDAFRRLAFADAVTVSCRAPNPSDPAVRTIAGSVESVLLEAARQHDEAAARDPGTTDDAFERGWDDVEAPPAVGAARGPAAPTFGELVELGVDALLAKRHADAYRFFSDAHTLHPEDPSVTANLSRLRDMGFAC